VAVVANSVSHLAGGAGTGYAAGGRHGGGWARSAEKRRGVRRRGHSLSLEPAVSLAWLRLRFTLAAEE
jgi:hypothetical protein